MNIYLTGSQGFLGGRLKKHLEVFHTVDCLEGNILDKIPTGSEYDVAIHLVGLNDHQCQKDPVGAYDVNVTGTHNLLSSVKAKKVIYFSTIQVYGYPACGKITEETKPNPQSVYAISHYLAERLVLGHPGGTVLRLSNGWGRPVSSGRATAWIVVMNAMCKKAVENKSIELFVPENEERNFITAADICRAVSHMVVSPETGVFNVGSSRSVRIVDMAYKVSDRCRVLFGYMPDVKLINAGSWDFYTPRRRDLAPYVNYGLDYRIDKLKATGFTPTENYEQEIDDLLMMCDGGRRDVSVGMSALRGKNG